MIRRVVVFVPRAEVDQGNATHADHVRCDASSIIDTDGGAEDERPTSDEPGCTEDPGLRR